MKALPLPFGSNRFHYFEISVLDPNRGFRGGDDAAIGFCLRSLNRGMIGTLIISHNNIFLLCFDGRYA